MGLAVTVFFTGCSSLTGSMEVDYKEIQTSAAFEAVTDENGENRLGITEETKEAPNYFEQNMTEKFKALEGKQAFQIKSGHSQEADDIESFQIAGLKNDRTFLYGYVTRVEDGGRPRKMVHCAALYHYDSGALQVFHENAFRRPWEDEGEQTAAGQADGEESFFVQVCDQSGDIFVYDNGHGYLYDSDGTMKFHGDIESFIRKQFQDFYDVSVVNAVADGQNRIYLEVSIEKEAVDVPELEREDLELTNKYSPVNSGMDQKNVAFETQKNAWIAQTAGKEYEEAPDALADWNQVLETHPDQWGDAWLGNLDNAKVYQWKEEAAFISGEGVTNFLPKPDSYVNFRDVKEQWQLEKLFILWDGKYSGLSGRTGNFIYYNPQEIQREYTHVWYEEGETSSEGESAGRIKHTEVLTQTLSGINTKRYAPLENAYVESYWVMDKESLDDETEELDEEAEQKLESRILVYEYSPVNSGMDQENVAFETQKNAWIAQTAGKEYEGEPDALADWNQVLETHPDQWGDAWLGSFDNAKVYQWKGEAAFTSEEGVTNFLPKPDSYVNFRDVKEQWQLEKLFIPRDGKYSDLFGRTKNFIYYNPQEIQREYTHVWYEEGETSSEGESAEPIKHTEVLTQTLSGINTKRYAPLENAYVESYWVMDKKKAVALGKCIGGEIQCTGEDGKVRWIQPGGGLLDTPYEVTEDTQAGAFRDGGVVYYVEFGKDSMAIVQDAAHGGNRNETPQKILYKNLAGGYEAGTSAYDAMLEKKNEENLPEVESVYGTDYYTEEQVLHASLSLDMILALELNRKGAKGICDLAIRGSTEGFLLTSQDKGLIFYAPATGLSAVLESGSWFGTWRLGNEYVSVGFLNGERSYNSLDVAFARVYEYDLSTLCNESMKASLEDIKAREAEEARRRAEEASRQAEEPSDGEEETKSPLDQWNEGYKKKYSR